MTIPGKTDTSNTSESAKVSGKDIAEVADDDQRTTAASSAAEDDDDNASRASSMGKKPLDSVNPTFGKLVPLIRGDVSLLLFGFLMMCLSEGAGLAVPIVIAKAWDSLEGYFVGLGSQLTTTDAENAGEELEKDAMGEISMWMGYSLLVYLVSLVLSWTSRSLFAVVGERMVARLRIDTYESVLKQEVGFYDEHKTGEIVSRLGNDTQLLQTTISKALPEAVVQIIKAILAFFLMIFISGKLTGVTLGCIVLVVSLAVPMGMKLATLSKLYQDVLGDAQGRSTEALGSIRTVQAFAAEIKELKRYIDKIGDPDDKTTPKDKDTTYRVGVKKAIISVLVFTIVFGGSFGFLYCVLWYGFYLVVVENELTLGGLSAFQSYTFIIAGAIGTSAQMVTQVVEGFAAISRVLYLLERKPKIKNFDGIADTDDESEDEGDSVKEVVRRKSIVPSTNMDGNIEFENVMFSYPTRPDVLVLNAFSLKLQKNTTTALVGSSGSGKSTVVSLIQRFYDIDGGKITLDGVDITHLDMTWLRSQIGYVQQEPQLFGVTIRENLTYGMSEEQASKITQTELDQACRDANAYEFISSWPEGYDTMVGERGVTLSGGQKQRVAIARAMLTDCRILLLDEATSALDAESEHEVQLAIENAMVGRTVVVVAHRLSTIQSADQIVVMDNRKIVDIGTHEELLGNCTRYQELIKRQSTMARDVSVGTLQKLLPSEYIATIDEAEA